MILSDTEIEAALCHGWIRVIPPPSPLQFQTSSLDLLLGDDIRELPGPAQLAIPGVHQKVRLDLGVLDFQGFLRERTTPLPRESDGSFVLPPRKFVLARTWEWIELPKESGLAARVEGRSSPGLA